MSPSSSLLALSFVVQSPLVNCLVSQYVLLWFISFPSQFGRVSPIVNISRCSMNQHIQPSMNKHESRLTPACLPTCCCLATLPLSDVNLNLVSIVARQQHGHLQRYIYISIYFSLEFGQLCSARPFGPTNLLTSLRSGLRFSLPEE